MADKVTKGGLPSKVLNAEKIALLDDLLDKGLALRIRVTGNSMTPFLQGGEILTIKKVPYKTLRKGDMIFFKSPDGFPVMHRIIAKKQQEDDTYIFTTKGDAVSTIDELVRENNILGKVCRIERTGSERKRKHVDMEMPVWKGINFSLALVSLSKGKITSHPALAGLLRRVKKVLV
jgi:signal peptidase I